MLIAGFLQFGAKGAIARDAAGGGDAGESEAAGSSDGFLDEDINNGGLDAGAKVADGLIILESFGVIAQKVANGSFETAEAEVVVWVVDHRSRERVGARIAGLGEAIHFGAAGIREAE